MLDIETGKIKDFIKFGVGNLCMVTGGRNCGRVGTVTHIEKHKGSFDVCHVKDATGALQPPPPPQALLSREVWHKPRGVIQL